MAAYMKVVHTERRRVGEGATKRRRRKSNASIKRRRRRP